MYNNTGDARVYSLGYDGEMAILSNLNVFKAHRDDNVKELAEYLSIQLIYVPACGTGEFQPLDRRLIGIVKKLAGYDETILQEDPFLTSIQALGCCLFS